jgi:hypothetical protein
MNPSNSTLDIDWARARERAFELNDNRIEPVPRPALEDALLDAAETDAAPGTLINEAISAGILDRRTWEEESEYRYAFNLEATTLNEDADTETDDTDIVDTIDLPDDDILVSELTVYPPVLRDRDLWTVRKTGDKRPRAPYRAQPSKDWTVKGTCHRAGWGQDLPAEERPETSFDTARNWAETDEYILESMDWNADDDAPFTLELGIILPPEQSGDNSLTLIDGDDVRDPESGEVHPAFIEIMERLDSYASLSTSGKGLHLYVYGSLPTGYGQFVEDIDDTPWVGDDNPKVEIYDHGHVAAMTGEHIEDTPTDISDGQAAIDWIIDEYEDEADKPEVSDEDFLGDQFGTSFSGPRSAGSGQSSPYFDASTTKVWSGANLQDTGGRKQGPHPVHGSSDGRNFALYSNGSWACFACDPINTGKDNAGGMGLQAVAIDEHGGLNCNCGEVGDLSSYSDREFLELCLIARDKYGFDSEWKPPGRVLNAIINLAGLADGSWHIARNMYDSMGVDDLRDLATV